MKKFFYGFLYFLLVEIGFTFAQEAVPNETGKWDYSYSRESKGGYRSELNYSMTPTELIKFRQKINEVVNCLHQNPVLANPKGFTATVQSCVYSGKIVDSRI